MQKSLWTVLLLVGAAACGDDGQTLQPDAAVTPMPDAPVTAACVPQALRTDLAWHGNNREDLTAWIASRGCLSEGYDKTKKPIAMFDWDNTIGKNDFGDAITFYMIKNAKVLQPPNKDWKQTSAYMTDAAAAALTAACGTTIAPGESLQTDTNTACADEMVSIYTTGATTAAPLTPAFSGPSLNVRWIEPTYAWTAQLMAGYTHAEIQAFASAAITPQLTAAVNTKQTVGTHADLNGWLRVYDQSKDLIEVIKSHGYDVWVITASPQDVIQTFAPMVGVPADHVIGIRSKVDATTGKLTYKFEGCGTVPEDNQAMIPYIQGKRCWINKVVFGDTTATAMQKRADGKRWVFAAGDSDTDIEFLRDSEYKFVLNRAKKELMCHAYYNAQDTWRINPMFIQPRSMQTTPFTCSTSACKNAAGVSGPCFDDAGNIIPDQADSVHP